MLSRLDKFWIALTSLGLASLILGALGLAALILASGCVHAPKAATAPEEPLHVLVAASVPGFALFCVEDPAINWTRPGEPKLRTGITCPMTVDELRHWVNHHQRAD